MQVDIKKAEEKTIWREDIGYQEELSRKGSTVYNQDFMFGATVNNQRLEGAV